jgi:hypothetical protein
VTLPAPTRAKGGRRTAAEEITRWLDSLDLDEATREAILTADPRALPAPTVEPLTVAAMADRALRTLYDELPGLKGIARVQAIKAILELASKQPKPEPPEPEPTIASVVAGHANLPRERVVEILTVERARMVDEIAEMDVVLADIGGVA